MSDDAVTMRVPAHGTKDAWRVGDAARGLQAIVRGFAEPGASICDDFVQQVVEDVRGEGFDVHVALADVTDEAQIVRAFAEIGEVWGLHALVNNSGIITLEDLEHTSATDFQRVRQLRWRTLTPLEARLPSAHTTEPGTELLPGVNEAVRHPHRHAWAVAIDQSRILPTTAHDLDISA
jgi:hypothetical protein